MLSHGVATYHTSVVFRTWHIFLILFCIPFRIFFVREWGIIYLKQNKDKLLIGRERERQRERDRQTDRQRDRQSERDRHWHTDTDGDR